MQSKRFIVFGLVAVLALLGVFAVSAQDDEMLPTIADIVVESAGADEPEFSTLLAAVQAADPAVLEALSDPEAELTVFAPTDEAFAALAEALGEEAFNGVLEDTETLTGILLYHVLGANVMSADVVGLLDISGGFFSVPTLNGQYIDVSLDEDGNILIDNNAQILLEMVDIEAANGVIHVINAVILPETRTLAEIVVDFASMEENAEFTTLLAAVQAADPAVLEALSDPEAELTVFAPTDEAFGEALESLGISAEDLLADTEGLTNILLYHVLEGRVTSADVSALAEETGGVITVTMLNGADAEILADVESTTIAGASIIRTNVDAANGIIHVIGGVMLPPAEE